MTKLILLTASLTVVTVLPEFTLGWCLWGGAFVLQLLEIALSATDGDDLTAG